MITIVPLDEGVFDLPRLTGIFLTRLPSWKTLICLVALSTSIVRLRPMVTVAERSMSPKRLPIGWPDRPDRTVILVLGFQNSGGRYMTWRAPNHRHAPG